MCVRTYTPEVGNNSINNTYIHTLSLLSQRACCYIHFTQTNSSTLFKTHSHSHLKH